MTRWFVSRHPGALEWLQRQGVEVDQCVAHLDVDVLRPGDTVLGTLPINLACEVCRRGVEYWHLSLRVPFALRGQELSAEQLDECHATLESFVVWPGQADG